MESSGKPDVVRIASHPSPSRLRATALTLVVVSAGMTSGAGLVMLAGRAAESTDRAATFGRVVDLVEAHYVDPLERDALVDAAIEGMIDRLDPHSTWMSAATWRRLQSETMGRYTGVGVEVQLQPQGARVTAVVPDSPASSAGINVGDLILAVDGRKVVAEDVDQTALLAPRGTATSLEVLREGWELPRTLHTVREEVRPVAVDVELFGERIAYARVSQFQEGVAKALQVALDPIAADGRLQSIVLDLRDNPGGLLSEAVATADLFLDGGPIVSTQGRRPEERRTYEATPGSYRARVVVLVNGLSASASEIVAAALQDTRRGELVGTRTYGKGSVQTVYQHQDGSALKLTVGRYHTPSGAPVAPRDGRIPDHVVPMPNDASPAARLRESIASAPLDDEARTRLMEIVDELPDAEVRRLHAPDRRPLADRLLDDPQLAAAIALAQRP